MTFEEWIDKECEVFFREDMRACWEFSRKQSKNAALEQAAKLWEFLEQRIDMNKYPFEQKIRELKEE